MVSILLKRLLAVLLVMVFTVLPASSLATSAADSPRSSSAPQPPSGIASVTATSGDVATLMGYANPGASIVLAINGRKLDPTTASHTGRYQFQGLKLTSPQGQLQIFSRTKRLFFASDQLIASKYFAIDGRRIALADAPFPAHIDSAAKSWGRYTVTGHYLAQTTLVLRANGQEAGITKTDAEGRFRLGNVNISGDTATLQLIQRQKTGWFSHRDLSVSPVQYLASIDHKTTLTDRPYTTAKPKPKPKAAPSPSPTPLAAPSVAPVATPTPTPLTVTPAPTATPTPPSA